MMRRHQDTMDHELHPPSSGQAQQWISRSMGWNFEVFLRTMDGTSAPSALQLSGLELPSNQRSPRRFLLRSPSQQYNSLPLDGHSTPSCDIDARSTVLLRPLFPVRSQGTPGSRAQ